MDKFWDLLERSVIVQGAITIIIVITLCYMFVSGKPVPESLLAFASLILGFWFGTKSQKEIQSRSAK